MLGIFPERRRVRQVPLEKRRALVPQRVSVAEPGQISWMKFEVFKRRKRFKTDLVGAIDAQEASFSRGALFFAYFLLGTQKKVSRRKGEKQPSTYTKSLKDTYCRWSIQRSHGKAAETYSI